MALASVWLWFGTQGLPTRTQPLPRLPTRVIHRSNGGAISISYYDLCCNLLCQHTRCKQCQHYFGGAIACACFLRSASSAVRPWTAASSASTSRTVPPNSSLDRFTLRCSWPQNQLWQTQNSDAHTNGNNTQPTPEPVGCVVPLAQMCRGAGPGLGESCTAPRPLGG